MAASNEGGQQAAADVARRAGDKDLHGIGSEAVKKWVEPDKTFIPAQAGIQNPEWACYCH